MELIQWSMQLILSKQLRFEACNAIGEEFGWAIETKNKASKTADGELQASHKLDGISVKTSGQTTVG